MAEWAWMEPGSENAHGPFKTREEALDDARSEERESVCVGQVDYPDPVYFAGAVADAESIVERMDEALADGVGEFYPGDDPMFELKPYAEEALRAALSTWAELYVERVGSWTLRETEPESTGVSD